MNKEKRIYLDNAATTPLDGRVLQAMMPLLKDNFGNASSLHSFGTEAKEMLTYSRKKIASYLNASADEIIFTGSGTESNNLALKGIAFANKNKGNHIIVSSIEHDCVLNTCKWLETQGFYVSYLSVNNEGLIDYQELEKLINPKTILVSVMHANNEVGSIQPIDEVGKICKQRKIYFHSDACQSFGKLEIDVVKANIDLLTINAHKIYGPKGVGALYINKEVQISPLLHGGGQEMGIRSSTENIAGIVGFAKAAELCIDEMESETKRISCLRNILAEELQNNYEGFYINGSTTQRLHTNLNFAISGLEGETIRLLLLLDEKGIAVSTGSACSNNDTTKSASHVLQAMGRNQFESRGAIRLSIGRFNTEDDIDYFIESFTNTVKKLNPIFS
ncbi:MAG TPA: cysteine desulfurase family protein [Bacteroidales bacterium]|nr:cysteine desulfurase family protein [Bacteroidales bacterium]HPS16987.1 cysteine desulfurase family protein [Bacteroidales bacterium]